MSVFTRQEYMAGSGADPARHRRYYAQLVNERTIAHVVAYVGKQRLQDGYAGDPENLNSIPLPVWDGAANRMPLAATFRELGDNPSLAGLVCVAKEAAKQWLERPAKPVPTPAEKPKPYCVPHNAGLASETSAVCRRIGRLLTALDTEINEHVVQGQIAQDIRNFRYSLLCKLEADGWSLSYDGGDRMKVRPPGHKKPFVKRTTTP